MGEHVDETKPGDGCAIALADRVSNNLLHCTGSLERFDRGERGTPPCRDRIWAQDRRIDRHRRRQRFTREQQRDRGVTEDHMADQCLNIPARTRCLKFQVFVIDLHEHTAKDRHPRNDVDGRINPELAFASLVIDHSHSMVPGGLDVMS